MTRTPGRARPWLLPALLVSAFSCNSNAANVRAPAPAGDRLPEAQITFLGERGEVAIGVEVAQRPEDVQRGLMFRRELAPGRGMLFIFPAEEVQRFWMKNTYIPLDMIFVSSGHTVVGVVPDVEPLTLQSRSVGVPSRYVIEVNAGFAARYGISTGTRVVITPET